MLAHFQVHFGTIYKKVVCLTTICPESSSEFVEQLGAVGLPHDLNIQSLFDPTGTELHGVLLRNKSCSNCS